MADPFTPAGAAAAMLPPREPTPRAGAPITWSVGALLFATADALAARFGQVVVRGEVSGVARAASGHCYFTLKDDSGAAASMRAVMFRRHAAAQGAALDEGAQVECRGRLTLYEARGDLQLMVEAVRPVGLGALYEAYLRLKAKLQADGLFEPERKRAIAPLPRGIGVVTSAGAAALQDVLTALARRAPHVPVWVFPTLVQGREAPPAIVHALGRAGTHAQVETVILCRGGGSMEDLWAFNDERVVRAVASQRQPIIVGVGHETDVTLAELAADVRAPTPTAAAELAAWPHADWLAELQASAQRLQRGLMRQLDAAEQRVDRWALALQHPRAHLLQAQGELRQSAMRLRLALRQTQMRHADRHLAQRQRLERAAVRLLEQQAHTLAQRATQLHALSPQHVLARGYAWVETVDDEGVHQGGKAITSAQQVHLGQALRTVWADGAALVRVTASDFKPPRA